MDVEAAIDPFGLVKQEIESISERLRRSIICDIPSLERAAEYFFQVWPATVWHMPSTAALADPMLGSSNTLPTLPGSHAPPGVAGSPRETRSNFLLALQPDRQGSSSACWGHLLASHVSACQHYWLPTMQLRPGGWSWHP